MTFDDLNICNYHTKKIISYYPNAYKRCCNPYKIHKKENTYRLMEITLEGADQVSNYLEIELIPGQKICKNCLEKVKDELVEKKAQFSQNNNEQTSSQSTNHSESTNSQHSYTVKAELEKMQSFLNFHNLSPIKTAGNFHKNEIKNYAKRKLVEINDSAEYSMRKILKVDENVDISVSSENAKIVEKHNKLLVELETKFQTSSLVERLQILTIVVDIMSKQNIIDYFKTSWKTVEKALN